MLRNVFLPPAVANYIAKLTAATHPDSADAPELVKQYVTFGASPRAAIGIAESARAAALFDGRPTCGFQDVKFVAPAALNHRLILSYKAKLDGVDAYAIIQSLIDSVDKTILSND